MTWISDEEPGEEGEEGEERGEGEEGEEEEEGEEGEEEENGEEGKREEGRFRTSDFCIWHKTIRSHLHFATMLN